MKNRLFLSPAVAEPAAGSTVSDAAVAGLVAAAAVADNLKRDATAADGLAAMKASRAAREAKAAASKAFRSCFVNMRSGDFEAAKIALLDHLDSTNSHVQQLLAVPNGVTIKGGASKADCIIDIVGFEQKKEVSGRVTRSIEANFGKR